MHEPYKYIKLCMKIFLKNYFKIKQLNFNFCGQSFPFLLKIENKTEAYFTKIMNALLHFKNFKEKSLENFL